MDVVFESKGDMETLEVVNHKGFLKWSIATLRPRGYKLYLVMHRECLVSRFPAGMLITTDVSIIEEYSKICLIDDCMTILEFEPYQYKELTSYINCRDAECKFTINESKKN